MTSGVYGVIHHPSYLRLFISSVGWSLTFRSAVGLFLTLLLVPPLLARINAEENLLRTQFGDDYAGYCSHTWRLIPRIY
jgi:protein-S-isoprenylcysteine O-methyltransferase Ste14